jgi:uncharacterized protein
MALSTKLTRRCNLACSYCYQTTARVVKNATAAHDYDIEAILKHMVTVWDWEDKHNAGARPAVIHGGEPLLAKKEDLEKMFRLHYERFGKCSMQSNGVLIDDEHIELFTSFNVSVGISVDGWGHLNSARNQSGSTEATLASTAKTLTVIQKLADIGRTPGLIVVLSRANATGEICPMDGLEPGDLGYFEEPITRRDSLLKFLEWTIETVGMQPGRLNPAHVDVPWVQPIVQLTNDDLSKFWQGLVEWSFAKGYNFGQVCEIRDVLFGLGQQTCVKTYCDPIATMAERPIQSDGSAGNCEHVYGADGIPYQRAEDDTPEDHRYKVLVGTDWEAGGCFGGPDGESDQACKWWAACNGQCPGQAIDGDWRNRSRFCESWAALYQAVYEQTMRMFPNVKLLPDIADQFDPHVLYHAVHSCNPVWDPFALQKATVTRRPSFYKGDARSANNLVVNQKGKKHTPITPKLFLIEQAKPLTSSQGGTAHGDHTDQTPPDVEHGDIDHGDHQDHGDSA